MKKSITIFASALLLSGALQAQTKIGLPAGTGNASSILDISNTGGGNKGFLAPQVALTGTTTAAPVTTPANGLIVYNTAAAGAGSTAVVPGYYYWNNTLAQWVTFNTSASALTTGNIYTNDGTFTGTRTVTNSGNPLVIQGTAGEPLVLVNSATAPTDLRIQNAVGQARIAIAGNPGDFGAPAAGDVMINGNTAGKGVGISLAGVGAPLLYAATTGNVGIGTTAPAAKLHTIVTAATSQVALQAANANKAIVAENTTAGGAAIIGFKTNNGAAIALGINPSFGGKGIFVMTDSSGGVFFQKNMATGNLNLNVNTFTGSADVGNVGIGPITPLQKLHVGGQVRIDTLLSAAATDSVVTVNAATGDLRKRTISDLINNSGVATNLYTGDGTLTSNRTVTSGSNTLSFVNGNKLIGLNTASNATDVLLQLRSGNTSNFARMGTTGSPLAIFTQGGDTTGSTPSLWVSNASNSGYVGIGTTSPTERLHVSGAGTGTSSITATNTTTGVNYIRAVAAGVDTRIQNNGGGYGMVGTFTNNDLVLTANGSTSVVLKPNGSMGFGTFSPAAKLDVVGDVRIGTLATAAATDSVVTVDAASGILHKRTITDLINNSGVATNIYNGNGTLTGARVLNGAGFPLSLTSTKVYLNPTGTIPNANQRSALEIPVSTQIASLATDSGYITLGTSGATAHTLIDFHSLQAKSGAAAASSFSMNPFGGNVGINTSAPAAALDVAGTARVQSVPQTSLYGGAPTLTTLFPTYTDAAGNLVKMPQLGTNQDTMHVTRIFRFTSLANATASAVTPITNTFFGTYEIMVGVANSSAGESVARFLLTGNNNLAVNALRYSDGNTDGNAATAITTVLTTPAAGGSWGNSTQIVVTLPGPSTITLRAGQNSGNVAAFSVTQGLGAAYDVFVVVKKIF